MADRVKEWHERFELQGIPDNGFTDTGLNWAFEVGTLRVLGQCAVDEIMALRRKVTRLECDVDMLTRADMDRAA